MNPQRIEQPIRIVIADDREAIRRALRGLLSTYEEFEVTGEARNGEAALALAESLHPDVILLDCHMSTDAGLPVVEEIKRRSADSRVVLMTMNPDLDREVLAEGADDCVVKGCPPEEFVEVLLRVSEADG